MWWQVSPWLLCLHACSCVCTACYVCLVWCSPYFFCYSAFFCYSQDTRGLGQATDAHVGLGWQGPKTELLSCSTSMWAGCAAQRQVPSLRLHAGTAQTYLCPKCFPFFRYCTSSSADKDLLWGYTPFLCKWQVGVEVPYKYTLVWSGSGARSDLIFHPEQTIFLAQNFF